MTAVSKVFFAALLFTGVLRFSRAVDGDATFYGGAGSGGSCSSSFVPDGFRTVAMNNAQYENGRACGTCVEGCFDHNGSQECFKAIVDNLCPECSYGDLDLGWSGDGRWNLNWDFIDCPPRDPIFSTQGSNCYYGKLKIEGLGPMDTVQLNGINASSTPDGYWVVNDGSGSLCCGPRLVASYPKGTIDKCLDGMMFGGGCSTGQICTGGNGPPPSIPNAVPSVPPPTEKVTEPVPPPTEKVTYPIPPPTEKVTEPVPPPTEKVIDPIPPPTEKVTEPVPPPTEKVTYPIPPPTEKVTEPVPPPTEKVTDPIPPPTEVTEQPAGAHCENGFAYRDRLTCCPKECGGCGGKLCSRRPGGAHNCCTSQILIHHVRSCKDYPAPCLMF